MVSIEDLREQGLRMGFDACGVAPPISAPHLLEYRAWVDKGFHGSMEYLAKHLPLKSDPNHLLPGVRSIIAVSLNYNQPNPRQEGYPRIARYALGRDYHRVMRAKLKRLASWLDERVPGAQHRPCVDSAPILERDYAWLAGLGWFGKNTMLIDTRRGSWFFIGLLLTTLELPLSEPAVGGCGTCRACIDACPTGCIVFEDGRWQIDARRCISYLTIEHKGAIRNDLAARLGGWTFGCDVCQEACPFNRPRENSPMRALQTREPDFLATRRWPSLRELRVIGEDEWDALTQGSAVRRAGRSGLARNAAANLEPSNRA